MKNCLDSLGQQSNNHFELFFVDYGSNDEYLSELEKVIAKYQKINFINCPVSGQLWNKCRAINIVLQKCNTPYFFVGDMDMIFHPDFVKKLYELKSENKVIYFKVGFLSKNETLFLKEFHNAEVDFVSQKEVTGMTLCPTKLLKEINGYNEFYHGWGAEDTDVHVRLQNLGIDVEFYNKEILLKHQWHPKKYRSTLSKDPYHFNLERINHSYVQIAQMSRQTKANINTPWGILPDFNEYERLANKPDFEIFTEPDILKVNAILAQFNNLEDKVVSITIKDTLFRNKTKQFIKRILHKKYKTYLSLKNVNDLILQEIAIHYRNLPYRYSFDQKQNVIQLKIYFQ